MAEFHILLMPTQEFECSLILLSTVPPKEANYGSREIKIKMTERYNAQEVARFLYKTFSSINQLLKTKSQSCAKESLTMVKMNLGIIAMFIAFLFYNVRTGDAPPEAL